MRIDRRAWMCDGFQPKGNMRAISTKAWLMLSFLGTASCSEVEPATLDESADTQIGGDSEVPVRAQEIAGERCDVASASRPRSLTLRGNLGTHDPVIIPAGGKYYEYQTGKFVYAKVSNDLVTWDPLPSQLPRVWDWMKRQVPGITDDLWAPDISYFGGQYHLYYSASTFGSNRSCIGHATRDATCAAAAGRTRTPYLLQRRRAKRRLERHRSQRGGRRERHAVAGVRQLLERHQADQAHRRAASAPTAS